MPPSRPHKKCQRKPIGRVRTLIVYGSCQAKELGRILQASPNVRSSYDVYVQWIGDQARLGGSWAEEIACADLVLRQDVPELKAFPPGHWDSARAPVFTFPFLSLAGLWPFDTQLGVADRVASMAQAAGRGTDIHYQDHLLGRMRGHIADFDERLAAYTTLSAPEYPKLAAYLARLDPCAYFMQKITELRRQDTAHGLGIGAAIASQIRQAPLFHTVTHPASPVLRRLAGELMGKAGLSLEAQSDLTDGFAQYQVPVHPMIARALGLLWAQDGRQWQFHSARVTFAQYYRHYIRTFG